MKILIAFVFVTILRSAVFSQQPALLSGEYSGLNPAVASVQAESGKVSGADIKISSQIIQAAPGAGEKKKPAVKKAGKIYKTKGGPGVSLAVVSTSAPQAVSVKSPVAVRPAQLIAESSPTVSAASSPLSGSKEGFVVNKRHIVEKGETLWGISGKYYKDPFKWGKIYNANINSVSNPDLIYPDSDLEIPDITEEVKPQAPEDVFIGSDETVKDPELTSSEILSAQSEEPVLPAVVPAVSKAAGSVMPGEKLEAFSKNGDLSEEMPVDQKEWGLNVEVVANSWLSDGLVASKASAANSMPDSLSISGETVIVKMRKPGLLKKGDILSAYLKGSPAYDKTGKKAGFELQRIGTLEVVSVDGVLASAVVTDSSTSIKRGMQVKKK